MCVLPGSSDLSFALVLRLRTVARSLYLRAFFCQLRLHFELKCNLKCLYQPVGYINATYTHANSALFLPLLGVNFQLAAAPA